MICRHPNLQPMLVDGNTFIGYYTCPDCGVMKGVRDDPHHYDKEYYYMRSLKNFVHGVPNRTACFAHYLHNVWEPLGINLENIDTILEIGCGIGVLAWSMSLEGKHVMAIEGSEWAFKWQKEAHGDKVGLEEGGFHLIHGNFETMESPAMKFDFIHANHVWEHLEDPMTSMERCFDLLLPGGKFHIVVPDKARELAMHHQHNWAWDEKDLRLWFEQAGFVNIKSRVVKGTEYESGGSFISIVGERS